MTKQNAGELLPGQDIIQLFRAAENNLAFISPVLATFARQNPGTLTLSLHRMAQDAQLPAAPPATLGTAQKLLNTARQWLNLSPTPVPLGETLAELTLPCADLADCEPLNFSTGVLSTAPGELLALRIRAKGTRRGAAPTLWLLDDGTQIPGHAACYIGAEHQGEFGILATLAYGGLLSDLPVPKMLLYSPVTQCNLNCIHCISAHTRTKVSRLPATIKDQMRKWVEAGQLEIMSSDYSGDILWADSRFGGELDFIESLGIRFHIDTNGVCLTPPVSERLCRMRMESLNISLDAATDATFKRVRKGAPDLAEVEQNIAALMRARAAAGKTFPVSMSFTLMRSTLHEWPDFLRMAAKLGVNLVIARHLEAFTPEMEPESLWNAQSAFNAVRPHIAALAEELGITATIPPPFAGTARTGRGLCSVPWHSAVVLGNGDVAACCVPGLTMGNLNEQSMEEIWNGERYQNLRATVNSPNPLPTCATCPMFRQTDNPDSYLIHSALQRIKA